MQDYRLYLKIELDLQPRFNNCFSVNIERVKSKSQIWIVETHYENDFNLLTQLE